MIRKDQAIYKMSEKPVGPHITIQSFNKIFYKVTINYSPLSVGSSVRDAYFRCMVTTRCYLPILVVSQAVDRHI